MRVMYKIPLGLFYEAVVYAKEDGNAKDVDHLIHQTFVSATQHHGTTIFEVTKHMQSGKNACTADALFSSDGSAIGVYGADCLPLVLVGEGAISVIHCSWRTLYAGLIHQVMKKFRDNGSLPSYAYLGPCIREYVVGPEFFSYFPAPFLIPLGEKYVFDLVGYTTSLLEYYNLTPEQIILDSGCTWRDSDIYWGYRRGDMLERNFVGIQSKS